MSDWNGRQIVYIFAMSGIASITASLVLFWGGKFENCECLEAILLSVAALFSLSCLFCALFFKGSKDVHVAYELALSVSVSICLSYIFIPFKEEQYQHMTIALLFGLVIAILLLKYPKNKNSNKGENDENR
jgi:hypothetical protein